MSHLEGVGQGAAGSGKLLSNIASLEKSLLVFTAALHWQKLLFGLSQGRLLAQIKLVGSKSHQMS